MTELDMVNHPPHYKSSEIKCRHCGECIECIDITRHMSFSMGNVMKYIWCYQKKGGLEDLKEAKWYLDDFIKGIEIINNL